MKTYQIESNEQSLLENHHKLKVIQPLCFGFVLI